MLSLVKIAVTGGLASGKSTVCQMFEELGAYVISADAIVHKLLSPDSAIGQKIIQRLGSDLVKNGQFDRKKIAKIVFSEPEKLKELESILHPAVFAEVEKRYKEVKQENKYSLFIAEIPLLYECHAEDAFDVVITVIAAPEQCKQRFIKESGHTDNEFKQRMARQIETEQKAKRSHYVIKNNSTLSDLKQQVITIFSLLT